MGQIHILTQFVWPDDAPTGIYAEDVAQALHDQALPVVVVGGRGTYRSQTQRPAPTVASHRVAHYAGSRHSLVSKAREYRSIHAAFFDYIREKVHAGDVVITTSAPPGSLTLHTLLRQKKARSVYWMQDYYPELIRALIGHPRPLQKLLAARWRRHLDRWDCVVKIAQNLGHEGSNVTVIRNWPTLDLGPERPCQRNTVLYAGNLGYAHDLRLLLQECERLRALGKTIVFRADGPKAKQLPGWIQQEPLLADRAAIVDRFWRAETHLIAADPRFPRAVFPSKYWNCRATGRKIICTGFAGEMLEELQVAQTCDYTQHVGAWVGLVKSLL